MIRLNGTAWLTDEVNLMQLTWRGRSKPQEKVCRLRVSGSGEAGCVIGIDHTGERLLYRDAFALPAGDVYLRIGVLESMPRKKDLSLHRILNYGGVWSSLGSYVSLCYRSGQRTVQTIYDMFRERDYGPIGHEWGMFCLRDMPDRSCILLGCRALEAGYGAASRATLRFLWVRIDKMGHVARREGNAIEMRHLLGTAYPLAATAAFKKKTNHFFYPPLPNQFLLSLSGRSALFQGIWFKKGPTWVENIMPKDKMMYYIVSQGQIRERKVFPQDYITYACWLKDDRHLVGQHGIKLTSIYPEDGYGYGAFVVAESQTGKVVYTYPLPVNYRLVAFYET